MIEIRRSEDRGQAEYDWLDTRYTFSFAQYHDRAHMGFSTLRVINQDRVAAGRGFDTHGHQDMEIVSYVLRGALEHKDSMGNGSRMVPGDVQIMSAGTGVTHSEYNPLPDEELELLQMWVLPARRGTEPRYEQKAYPESERRGRLRLVVDPEGEQGAVSIGQDARLYAGLLDGSESIRHELASDRSAWLHVARGKLTLNGQELGPGDGAAIVDEPTLTLENGDGAELVLWDLPRA